MQMSRTPTLEKVIPSCKILEFTYEKNTKQLGAQTENYVYLRLYNNFQGCLRNLITLKHCPRRRSVVIIVYPSNSNRNYYTKNGASIFQRQPIIITRRHKSTTTLDNLPPTLHLPPHTPAREKSKNTQRETTISCQYSPRTGGSRLHTADSGTISIKDCRYFAEARSRCRTCRLGSGEKRKMRREGT